MFGRIDEARTGGLDIDNLKWAFRNYGLDFTDDELKTFMVGFDTSKTQQFDYAKFFTACDVIFKNLNYFRMLQMTQEGKSSWRCTIK